MLQGDFFYVDPGQDFAQSDTAVHVLADPSSVAQGDYTFYGRYNGFDGSDARLPLSSLYHTRYLNGGAFDGTRLFIWRDNRVSPQRAACRAAPLWLPLGEARLVAFDEHENAVELPGLDAACPSEPGGLSFACDVSTGGIPFGFGALWLDLRHGSGAPAQAWVSAVVSAEGRYSVSHAAARMDDLCLLEEAGAPILP